MTKLEVAFKRLEFCLSEGLRFHTSCGSDGKDDVNFVKVDWVVGWRSAVIIQNLRPHPHHHSSASCCFRNFSTQTSARTNMLGCIRQFQSQNTSLQHPIGRIFQNPSATKLTDDR